jgi:Glyoxalase-like domain
VLRIDHAVLAVADLDEAGDRLLERTGLEFVRGGVHPAWGTANRIAPLGDDYVEIICVTDPVVGTGNHLGRTLLDLTQDGNDRWFSICLRDDDIERTAARLGLTVEAGSRTRPDGVELRWRGAGIEDPQRPIWLPFFIAWDVPADRHPGRARARHRVHPTGIVSAEIGGDPAAMRAWVGGAELPLTVTDDGAPPGVRSVTVGLAGGGGLVI